MGRPCLAWRRSGGLFQSLFLQTASLLVVIGIPSSSAFYYNLLRQSSYCRNPLPRIQCNSCHTLLQDSKRGTPAAQIDVSFRSRANVFRDGRIGQPHSSAPFGILAASSTTSPDSSNNNASSSTAAATTKNQFDRDQELQRLQRQFDDVSLLYHQNVASAGNVTPAQLDSTTIRDLEREQSDPDFWQASNGARATQATKLLSDAVRLRNRLMDWEQWYGDAVAALEMLQSSSSEDGGGVEDAGGNEVSPAVWDPSEQQMLLAELEMSLTQLQSDCETAELEWLLSGPYDDCPARILITAGAGGDEANDWVEMLYRMYSRFCDQSTDFTLTAPDFTPPADGSGYKSVEFVVTGPMAYGWWSGEKGAHRLVRLNPAGGTANAKRHTTFAGVHVGPDLADTLPQLADVELPDSDLVVTAMRSSGAGGQNVNKVSSKIRIHHVPSGLTVSCQEDRSQLRNKETAMNRLKAQLLAIAQEQRVSEIQEINGDLVQASWGAQIRNYVLNPYKLVKDQRTGWETSSAQSFLDGDLLRDCISAYLRHKAEEDRLATLEANKAC